MLFHLLSASPPEQLEPITLILGPYSGNFKDIDGAGPLGHAIHSLCPCGHVSPF